MGDIKQNLIAAKALIDTPEKWNQGAYHEGGFHGFDRHCTLGAIMATSPNFDEQDAMGEALRQQLTPAQSRLGHCIATFNDTHTHPQVMALFDHAIAAQEPSP